MLVLKNLHLALDSLWFLAVTISTVTFSPPQFTLPFMSQHVVFVAHLESSIGCCSDVCRFTEASLTTVKKRVSFNYFKCLDYNSLCLWWDRRLSKLVFEFHHKQFPDWGIEGVLRIFPRQWFFILKCQVVSSRGEASSQCFLFVWPQIIPWLRSKMPVQLIM